MKASKLAEWRKKWEITQSELASALGVDVITVSRWERGLQEPAPFLALALEALENRIMHKDKGGMKMESALQSMEDIDFETVLNQILAPEPPTYKKIQKEVKNRHGFTPETCWIANVKEIMGLNPRKAPNRQGPSRMRPCPPDKIDLIRKVIEDAMSK